MAKCKSCKETFERVRPMQVVCFNYKCAIDHGRAVEAKKQKKKDKKTKESLKTSSQWKAEAQAYFNKFIRLRDYWKPCISCDREEVEMTSGGNWDCGHFLSRGGFPELRFVEINAHKQCKSCNGGSSKYAKKSATVAKSYRVNLIDKIGIEKVEWLEGPHEPKRYTIDDIKAIKAKYREKCRELIKGV